MDGTSEFPGDREAALEGLAREKSADRAVQLVLKATERQMAAIAEVLSSLCAHVCYLPFVDLSIYRALVPCSTAFLFFFSVTPAPFSLVFNFFLVITCHTSPF